jgi:cell volume regulation protein A
MAPEEIKDLGSGVFLIVLGGLLVLSFIAEEAFERRRVPPVLVLITAGLLLGPATGLLPERGFLAVAPQFGAVAFLLILFEGGLDLDVREVLSRLHAGAALALANFVIAFGVGAAVGAAGGLGLLNALAFGVVLAPVSGAIVIPLAGRLGLGIEARTIVVLEAALADVFGILGLTLLSGVAAGGGVVALVALGSLGAALASALAGVAAGLAWPRVLRWLGGRRYVDVLSFGAAMTLWGVTEMLGASGALAVLLFGLSLANEEALLVGLGLPTGAVAETTRRTVRRTHRFIAELTFLVRTFFFVFLGVIVRFSRLPARHYLEAAAVIVLFFVGLAVTVGVLARRRVLPLAARERRAVWLLQPRGLVSAVLAIQAGRVGLDPGGTLLGVASLVILATNLPLLAVGRTISRPASRP